ncbi:MAG: sarcosine oxidase [Alphaproteobacteria bacterium]|nr:sarcosine oxidase [Alphaproteobacteria bacterium]
MTDPAQHTRRSPVYRKLVAAGATFREAADGAVAATVPGAPRPLGLADLSVLPRLGYKGPGALAALATVGVPVPEANNTALAMPGGGLVARLADSEALLLGDPTGTGDPLAAYGALHGAGCYAMPRRDSHAWFTLAGDRAADCLAKLCGVDLRPHRFADGAIAQTSLARMNGILIRDDRGGALAYHILADSASAPYLWDCLIDAMAEYDGGPVGLDDLASFASAE